ncbi:MAG: hypothetical protein JOZ82_11585, partial [Marmoricola sp.]|nr:hypothetical protein [Marmoricola sp.]
MASNVVTSSGESSTREPFGTTATVVAEGLDVDPTQGLSSDEATRRLGQYGANRLSEKKAEPGWHAFLRQYQDFMQVVLLVAAVVNQLVTGEPGTSVVLAGLTVFNAVIGVRQE